MRVLAAVSLLTMALVVAAPLTAQQATPEPTGSADGQAQIAALAIPLYERAGAALQSREYERAMLDFSLFILLNPTSGQAYFGRALSHLGQNDLDGALVDLEQALAVAPDEPAFRASVHRLRASLLASAGREEQALDDYTQALELAPEGDIYVDRALLYLRTRMFSLALADLDRALELLPEDADLYNYRAFAYAALARDADAARDYQRFLQATAGAPVEGDALAPGEFVVLQFEQGVVYSLPFEGRAGQVLNAVALARPETEVDPLLVLLDPDGEPISANDDRGGGVDAGIGGLRLPVDGTYMLLVGHSLGGAQGEVGVAIEFEDAGDS